MKLNTDVKVTFNLKTQNDNMLFLVVADGNFELSYEALDAIQPDMQQ
jgi:hypothetical protein